MREFVVFLLAKIVTLSLSADLCRRRNRMLFSGHSLTICNSTVLGFVFHVKNYAEEEND